MTTLSSKSSYPRGEMEVQLQATLSHEMDGDYKDTNKGSGSNRASLPTHGPHLTFIQQAPFHPFKTKAALF